MKVLVCGTRGVVGNFAYYMLKEELKQFWPISEIIHGACPDSPDMLAAQYCHEYEIKETACSADWRKYGRRAGYVRNAQMVQRGPDAVVALWNGKSKGTLSTIQLAISDGIPVNIVPGTPDDDVELAMHGSAGGIGVPDAERHQEGVVVPAKEGE